MATTGGLRQRLAQAPTLDTLAESPTKESSRPDKPLLTHWCTWSPQGIAVYAVFLAATAFYFHVRLTTTLDLAEYFWYGAAILVCEAVGASAVVLYGLTIIRCMPPDYVQQQIKPAGPGEGYDLQVLVPCYTEDLKIVAETVSAAVEADMPPDSTCTVWLLDDGNDPNKRAWVEGLGDDCVRYITGRKRPADEVNGKAGNVNNAMSVIYGDRAQGSLSERDVLAIFDCDQVCAPEFFVEALPLLNGSPDVGMVLTPQQFRKVDDDNDIFNHSNRHFWEVMIPGMSAWGMVVCTGSNLLVRSPVVQAVGGFPGKTITEDYMLGLELAKAGLKSRYLQKYMALGEAPEEGAIFRQRSRWCKGHMQALMSSENPLIQPRLSPLMRVLYTAGTWSYICAALTSPAFTLVPLVAVVWGISPLSLNPKFAVAFPIYIASMHAVVYFCNSWSLLRALWFGSCSNQILWYTYCKAIVNTVLWAAGLKRKGRFKTTIKTGDMLMGTPRTPRTPKTPKTPAVPFSEKLSAALAANQEGAPVRHASPLQRASSSQPDSGAATPPLGDQAKRAHVSFEGARDAEPKSVHASPGKTRFADIQVDATQAGSQGSETTASHLPAEEVTQHSRLGADERPQPPRSPYETVAPMPSNLQRLKTGASGSLLESMASLTHGSFSLSRGTSLARAGSALLRSSSMARQMTVPELQREVSLHGRRPSWNLQAAQAPSSTKPPAGAAAAPDAASPQVGLGKVQVWAISFGQVRDLWVPMLVLAISLFTAMAAGYQVLTSPAWGVFSGLPGTVTLLWALYNCIGPYLLLHYTYLGRQDSLRVASSLSMHLALGLAVLAVALLVMFSPTSHDLAQVLNASYRFFEAQRSGRLPADNRISWRGDSALADLAPNGASLAGGWYDAGDHLKTSFSMGLALSFLSWGAIAFPQGHEVSGQLHHARSSIQWATEYLIKCHIRKEQFVGQVGNMELDHDYWGRPEDMEAAGVIRPAYVVNATHPGADMAGMAAAGLASASLALKSSNPKLAKAALKHAKQLWDFGAKYPGSFAQSVPEIGAVYPSSAWRDDMAWGAAWLHMASGKRWYRKRALQYLQDSRKHEPSRWQYYVTNWDNMVWATQALLATGPAKHAESAAAMEEYLGKWRRGQVVNYTRQGLAWSDQWGALRNTGNVAMLALLHAQHLPARQARPHQCWALSQLRYMIGEGPHSFVVGYGRGAPRRPHHRAASCPPTPQACNHSALEAPSANPHELIGALVGGPDLQDAYADDRSDYVTAEVGIEYSAGFTAAVAGALQMGTSWAVCQQGRVMQ